MSSEKEQVQGSPSYKADDYKLGIEPSKVQYKAALKRIESIFDSGPGTLEGKELEKLISFVEAYEDKHYRI
ncbi:hypothetical protein ABIS04_13410 [Shewanella sp. H8]|uniref:hypothetical protein n=1 Tax=Shewanella sp. H8 TaxID=3342676 RepID=UPI003314A4D4